MFASSNRPHQFYWLLGVKGFCVKDFNERVDECVNYTGINVRMTLYMDSTKHMLQKYTEFKHRSHFFFFLFLLWRNGRERNTHNYNSQDILSHCHKRQLIQRTVNYVKWIRSVTEVYRLYSHRGHWELNCCWVTCLIWLPYRAQFGTQSFLYWISFSPVCTCSSFLSRGISQDPVFYPWTWHTEVNVSKQTWTSASAAIMGNHVEVSDTHQSFLWSLNIV